MHHGDLARRLAELLDRCGYAFLSLPPERVRAAVAFVGRESSLVRLTAGPREFDLVVGPRDADRIALPPVIKFPA